MLNKRDHRIINKKINIYYISKISPGMIFWNYKGFIILKNLKKLIREKLYKYNYKEIITPNLINKKIWIQSGHWKNYKKFIFSTKYKNDILCIKPMNCIGHIKIFNYKIRSYKKLPIRIAEFGTCYRNENSGSLHGLIRTKSFIQDDGHIFCTIYQIDKEISKCINMIYEIYKIFNFNKIYIYLSTRPKKYIGNIKIWNTAEKQIIHILKKKKIKYLIKDKEGAFYGPKIEFVLKDYSNRKWQCGTIQLDYFLSKKLKIFYLNKNNIKKNPIIIHRAILGSLERFIGILIEQYNGILPLWLCSIKIVVLNISIKHLNYSKYILKTLKNNNIFSIGDFTNKKINYKIKKYTLQKIPYMIICGDEEVLNNNISVRKLKNNKLYKIKLKKFIKKINNKIKKFK